VQSLRQIEGRSGSAAWMLPPEGVIRLFSLLGLFSAAVNGGGRPQDSAALPPRADRERKDGAQTLVTRQPDSPK